MPKIEYLIVNYLSTKDITRIFSRIKVIPETGCWEWQGARLKQSGYGVIRYQHTTETLHRLLYAWAVGPLPKRKRGEPLYGTKELDHVVCSNKRCCNPCHVLLVTHKFNSLRSSSPPALNSQKTHCHKGHLLPPEPTEFYADGSSTRRCIFCRRIAASVRYQKRRDASTPSPT